MFSPHITNFCDTIEFYTVCYFWEYQCNVTDTSRLAYKAIGRLGNYLGIANWMDMWNK